MTITCTIRRAWGVCGEPAITTFVARDGTVYAECATHARQEAAAAAACTPSLRTRSRAPYALVVRGRIVGYAHSTSPAVAARARRLGAAVVPIVDGRVSLS